MTETYCDHCGKPEQFNVLCPDCERLVCRAGCGRVKCVCPRSEKTMKLRIWHISNVPNRPFYAEVADLSEALLLLTALADYDLYLDSLIQSNAQGLEVWYEPGETTDQPTGEWIEWCDEEDYNIDHYYTHHSDEIPPPPPRNRQLKLVESK